jgi:hypothetical protein
LVRPVPGHYFKRHGTLNRHTTPTCPEQLSEPESVGCQSHDCFNDRVDFGKKSRGASILALSGNGVFEYRRCGPKSQEIAISRIAHLPQNSEYQ